MEPGYVIATAKRYPGYPVGAELLLIDADWCFQRDVNIGSEYQESATELEPYLTQQSRAQA